MSPANESSGDGTHELTLRHHKNPRGAESHSGTCTCGWESELYYAAGLVHGAFNGHMAQLPGSQPEE